MKRTQSGPAAHSDFRATKERTHIECTVDRHCCMAGSGPRRLRDGCRAQRAAPRDGRGAIRTRRRRHRRSVRESARHSQRAPTPSTRSQQRYREHQPVDTAVRVTHPHRPDPARGTVTTSLRATGPATCRPRTRRRTARAAVTPGPRLVSSLPGTRPHVVGVRATCPGPAPSDDTGPNRTALPVGACLCNVDP